MHSSLQHGIPESQGLTEAPYRIWGDIVMDPSVAIAPGSFLLAEPGCQLRLAPGVCIGTGCIIHVFGGDLEIDIGTVVGSAVLLVGNGKIGAKACIGAAATLVNPTVEAGHMIRQNSFHGSLGLDGAVDLGIPDGMASVTATEVPMDAGDGVAIASGDESSDAGSSPSLNGADGQPIASQVYGLEAFYRLMAMLFPHRDFPPGITPMPGTPPTPSTQHQPDGGEVR